MSKWEVGGISEPTISNVSERKQINQAMTFKFSTTISTLTQTHSDAPDTDRLIVIHILSPALHLLRFSTTTPNRLTCLLLSQNVCHYHFREHCSHTTIELIHFTLYYLVLVLVMLVKIFGASDLLKHITHKSRQISSSAQTETHSLATPRHSPPRKWVEKLLLFQRHSLSSLVLAVVLWKM